MNKKPLTSLEHFALGTIINKEIESVSKLSIDAFRNGKREAYALFEGRKAQLMAIRSKLGLE